MINYKQNMVNTIVSLSQGSLETKNYQINYEDINFPFKNEWQAFNVDNDKIIHEISQLTDEIKAATNALKDMPANKDNANDYMPDYTKKLDNMKKPDYTDSIKFRK